DLLKDQEKNNFTHKGAQATWNNIKLYDSYKVFRVGLDKLPMTEKQRETKAGKDFDNKREFWHKNFHGAISDVFGRQEIKEEENIDIYSFDKNMFNVKEEDIKDGSDGTLGAYKVRFRYLIDKKIAVVLGWCNLEMLKKIRKYSDCLLNSDTDSLKLTKFPHDLDIGARL
ncbi:17514_t:CDS:2, partial [Funneliformis geosporum]